MRKTIASIFLICFATLGYVAIDLKCDNQALKEKNEVLESKINECIEIHSNENEECEERQTIVEIASEAYGIESQLLEAIERLETANYTSEIYHNNCNTWGAFDGVKYLYFDNKLQSTLELARTLKYNYINKGFDTLETIGKVYCPSDELWAQKVKEIYEELKNEG